MTGWEDVGGLLDVREALQEALELPTKFAKLLATYAARSPTQLCHTSQAFRKLATQETLQYALELPTDFAKLLAMELFQFNVS